jgi:hypothetical protein
MLAHASIHDVCSNGPWLMVLVVDASMRWHDELHLRGL